MYRIQILRSVEYFLFRVAIGYTVSISPSLPFSLILSVEGFISVFYIEYEEKDKNEYAMISNKKEEQKKRTTSYYSGWYGFAFATSFARTNSFELNCEKIWMDETNFGFFLLFVKKNIFNFMMSGFSYLWDMGQRGLWYDRDL